MSTSVQRARKIVNVGRGEVATLQSREARRARVRAKQAIRRGDFDALSRVQPRRSIAWEIA